MHKQEDIHSRVVEDLVVFFGGRHSGVSFYLILLILLPYNQHMMSREPVF
jgi:hypothetical protein